VPPHLCRRTQRTNLGHLGGRFGIAGLAGIAQAEINEKCHVTGRKGLGDGEQADIGRISIRGITRRSDPFANARHRCSQLTTAGRIAISASCVLGSLVW
jgi:hypothetical protein